jgi:thiol-disulfide isomerase/thioredoxin
LYILQAETYGYVEQQEVETVAKKNAFAVCVVLCISAMIFSGCARRPPESESMVDIGQAAPSFKLPDLNGQQVSLDQYKGKIVMLDFWATWCGPCRMTMPIVENLQKEYVDTMVLLTINLQESHDVVRDYIRAQGIRSRVLLDEEGLVGKVYGTESIPLQILIDKQGIVRFIQAGYGPGMASRLRAEINKLRQPVVLTGLPAPRERR